MKTARFVWLGMLSVLALFFLLPKSALTAQTPLLSPTSTPEVQGCPLNNPQVDNSILYVERESIFPDSDIDNPITLNVFESRTLEFLNAGGAPIRLQDLWRNQQVEITVRTHDFDKDGAYELFLMVSLPEFQSHTGVGFLHCRAGRYQPFDWITAGPYEYDPTLITIEDLNHDGNDEVILTQRWSGSDCTQNFWVMGWRDKRIEWWLERANLTCDVHWMVRDVNGDGSKEIVMEGYRSPSNSLDHRRIKKIYALQDERYHIIAETIEAPHWRVDYMEDGYNALLNGDISRAIELYEIAVFDETFNTITSEEVELLFTNDPTLNDVIEAREEAELNRAYISVQNMWGLAHFRLLTFYYYQGQYQAGEKLYEQMETYFPDDRGGYEFREAAALFMSRWNRYGDIQRACHTANLLLEHYARLPNNIEGRRGLGFRNDYWTYDAQYGSAPDWCLIPAAQEIVAPVTVSFLPPPLPPQRITDETSSACVPPRHADERLLYLDQGYIFTSNSTTRVMSPEIFIEKALTFLNGGGAPLQLQDVWRSQNQFLEMQQRDLDGDGVEELLFTVSLQRWQRYGGIGVFYCHSGQYRFGGWYHRGTIIAVEDLDQDGLVEIVLKVKSTIEECTPVIQVIQWQNHTYQNKLQGTGSDCLGGYIEYLIADEDGDGKKEIYTRGSQLNGDRKVYSVYTLQDGVYRLFFSE